MPDVTRDDAGHYAQVVQAVGSTYHGQWYIVDDHPPHMIHLHKDGQWRNGCNGDEAYWPTREAAEQFLREHADPSASEDVPTPSAAEWEAIAQRSGPPSELVSAAVTINNPLADLIFRKCGLTQEQAVRVAEVVLSERPWLTGPEAKTLLADLERQGSTIARLNEQLAAQDAQEPAEGRELPDEPGRWSRDDGQWDLLVQKSNKMPNPRLNFAGFSAGRFKWGWLRGDDSSLPRGSWHKAASVERPSNHCNACGLWYDGTPSEDACPACDTAEENAALKDIDAHMKRLVEEAQGRIAELRTSLDAAVQENERQQWRYDKEQGIWLETRDANQRLTAELTALRSQRASVQGALADAGDVLAQRTDGDYGASVREVVEQRDAAREQVTRLEAELEAACRQVRQFDSPMQLLWQKDAQLTALRTQVTRLEQERDSLREQVDLWAPKTDEQIEQMLDEIEAAPMSDEEVEAIVAKVVSMKDDPAYAPDNRTWVILLNRAEKAESALTARDEELRRLRDELEKIKAGRFNVHPDALSVAMQQCADAALASLPPPRTYVGDGQPLPSGVWLTSNDKRFAVVSRGEYVTYRDSTYTFVGPVPEEEGK